MESDMCRFVSKVSTVLPKKKAAYIYAEAFVKWKMIKVMNHEKCTNISLRIISVMYE